MSITNNYAGDDGNYGHEKNKQSSEYDRSCCTGLFFRPLRLVVSMVKRAHYLERATRSARLRTWRAVGLGVEQFTRLSTKRRVGAAGRVHGVDAFARDA